MRKILIATLASLAFSHAALAAPATYEMVKEKSSLKFFAIQNGAPVEGRFNDFDATILFDTEKPDESSFTVEVATGSLSAAHSDVETSLKLPEWLSVEKFPKAVYKSTKITRMPNSDNYIAEGKLTMRDKTVPVTINFQLKAADKDTQIATGYATLLRSDYGVGQGQWAKHDVIKNEVRVEFRLLAKRK